MSVPHVDKKRIKKQCGSKQTNYIQLQYNPTQLGMSQDDSAALKDTEVLRIEAADACSSIKHVLQQSIQGKSFETNAMSSSK